MPKSTWVKSGTLRYSVEVTEEFAFRGETVSGQVLIEGRGLRPAQLRRVAVHFYPTAPGYDFSAGTPSFLAQGGLVLAKRLWIAPDEQRSLPFRLPVPGTARLQHFPLFVTAYRGFCVPASLFTPKVSLRVLPDRLVHQVLDEVARLSDCRVISCTTYAQGQSVRAELRPLHGTALLRSVVIIVHRTGQKAECGVTVHPGQRAMRREKQTALLHAAPGDLPAFRTAVWEILKPYLDTSPQLPIPASSTGTPPESLPLPAAAPETDVEQLPVPSAPGPAA